MGIVAVSPAQDPTLSPIPLHLPDDTLRYRLGDNEGFALLTTLGDSDRTEISDSSDLVLFSALDTVVVSYSAQPIHVLMMSPRDTVLETVTRSENKLTLLRRFPGFELGPAAAADSLPVWNYQSPDDPDLVQLRETFRLDSVAGSGSEVERMVNLMRWAHTVVRHDGNSANPHPSNALHLIEVCRTEDRGVNCRMMATILNEAYLAVGFKSRHITCMPYSQDDPDCHVVTAVWSDSLGRWLAFDPTFEAYFMDESGGIIGLREARERLIRGETVKVNPEMNWNGKNRSEGEHLRYMTKNLFRFLCPVAGEFGYESKEGCDWVYLDPIGFDCREHQDSTRIPINHRTQNADYFWARP